jgi:hypothetical protein
MATASIRNHPLRGKHCPVNESRPDCLVNFWARVAISGEDECWEWQGARQSQNYGNLRFNGRPHKAHRVAFYLTYGHWPIPKCLHSCDNPPCVNPAHLSEGTQLDNVRQAKERGRLRPVRGENAVRTSLKNADIQKIRQRLGAGEAPLSIAKAFGVERPVIYQIKCGKNWASV